SRRPGRLCRVSHANRWLSRQCAAGGKGKVSRGGRGRSAGPDDGLELGVGVQAERAPVAADTRQLEPSERRLVVALGGVDADVAAAQLLRYVHGAGRVRREDVVVQPEVGAVGKGDSFVLVV